MNRQSILYKTVRYAPYYYYLVFLAVRFTVMFIDAFRPRRPSSRKVTSEWKYVQHNLLKPTDHSPIQNRDELTYFHGSFTRMIEVFQHYIYRIRPYFRYSKLIVCIYTGAFTLIYYFTFWILDHTYLLTKKLLLFLNIVLCTLASLSKDLCYNLNLQRVNEHMRYVCLITALAISVQLLFSLRHYQRQMCQAYRGLFRDIPSPRQVKSTLVVSKSIHYPGRFMGKYALGTHSAQNSTESGLFSLQVHWPTLTVYCFYLFQSCTFSFVTFSSHCLFSNFSRQYSFQCCFSSFVKYSSSVCCVESSSPTTLHCSLYAIIVCTTPIPISVSLSIVFLAS